MASPESIESLIDEEQLKPRLRGVSHALAFVAALVGCFFLARAPARGLPHLGGLVFGFSLVLMFGVSGMYHCPNWSPAVARRLQRCDHAAIFVIIAGSFTPMAALDTGGWGLGLLGVMWIAALTGAGLSLAGHSGRRGPRSLIYVVLGSVSLPVLLHLPDIIGPARVRWLVFELLLYVVGAGVYARRWPDPHPSIFGFHEVFHLMVITAASVHYAVVLGVLSGW